MNNKGAEKIISVYWFIMLILVAGGIYGMVYTFYGHPFDVRELEANILINNVADCISEKGVINQGLFDENGTVDKNFDDNFLDICNINFNVEKEHKWDEKIQYYLQVNFYNVENLSVPFSTISKGNNLWVSGCDINEKAEFGIWEKCKRKRFYSVSGDKQILMDVLSIVRKTEKNVKL